LDLRTRQPPSPKWVKAIELMDEDFIGKAFSFGELYKIEEGKSRYSFFKQPSRLGK
jgi:hypothetical protein